MQRFRCVVIDHLAGAPLLQQTLALLEARDDIECSTAPVQSVRHARADLVILCSGAAGRDSLLPLVSACRSVDAHRALLVIGELECERDLRALNALGVSDFVRLPLSPVELNARIDRTLGIAGRLAGEPVGAWLGAGDLMLTSANARFNAQLARLPRLASAGLDVIVCGAPGTGRRAFARALAGAVGDAAPCAVEPGTIDRWLEAAAAPAPAAAADGRARCLLVYDLEQIKASAQQALCERLRTLRAAGEAVRLVATAAADAPMLQARGELIAPLAELFCAHRVRMPSLRERPEDIVLLARAAIDQMCRREQRPAPGLTPAAAARLIAHDWPDNVFGLRRAVQRSLHGAGPMIGAADLLLDGAEEHDAREQSLQEVKARLVVSFERSFLEQLLAACRGNINMAARMSNKNRRSLFELIRKHEIDVDRYRQQGEVPPPRAEEQLALYQVRVA